MGGRRALARSRRAHVYGSTISAAELPPGFVGGFSQFLQKNFGKVLYYSIFRRTFAKQYETSDNTKQQIKHV